ETSSSVTRRAPGMWPAAYSPASPTCSSTISGSLTCAASHGASTTASLRGSAMAPVLATESANTRHASANDEDFMGCSDCGLSPQCLATPTRETLLQPTAGSMRPTGALSQF